MPEQLSSDCLRTLYQESASMFLLSSHVHTSQEFDKSEINPMQSARSLILRSMYNKYPLQPGKPDHATCILSNAENVSSLESNRFRSGAYVTSLTEDAEEKEFSILEQKMEELRECRLTTVEQRAEVFSKHMLNSSELKTGSTVIRSDFNCSSCGLPYFPIQGNNCVGSKVQLKRLKRGRTRRRRASRYAAAKYTLDNDILQKHRGGGKAFTSSINSSHGSAVASVMETNLALKKAHNLRRISDGISKHCIVYKCSCGHNQSFKGCRRQNNNEKNTKQESGDRKKHLLTTSGKKNYKKKNGNENVSQKGANEFDRDFLALTPVAKTPNSANSSLLLSKGKKRRAKPKKAKPSSKSGLHDFLSSLND